jgi:hypothetical protein
MLRDISSIGTSKELETYLNTEQKFVMVPTNGFSLEKECIKIKELYGDEVCVPTLSIDSMIFRVIGKKIDNEQFCNAAEECLDESFPIDKKKDFINLLWKRVFLLMTYGLLIPMKSSL